MASIKVNKPLSTVRQSEVSEVPPLRSRSLIDVCEPFSQSKSSGGGGDGDWQLFPLSPSPKYCHTKAKQDPTTQLDGHYSSPKLRVQTQIWLCIALEV